MYCIHLYLVMYAAYRAGHEGGACMHDYPANVHLVRLVGAGSREEAPQVQERRTASAEKS